MSDTTDPQNTAAHSKTSGTQSCSHTHSHTCHTRHTQTHKHTHTSQRERPKDKPPTLEKTRGPFHHGAGVGAGQGTEGAKGREHKLRPPPKKLHLQLLNKGKFFCDMKDWRCVVIIYFKPRRIIKARRQTYFPGLSQWIMSTAGKTKDHGQRWGSSLHFSIFS